jgi:ABC-type dipeptide/oligopeptide/nickel transport system ATPase component
MSLLEIDSLAVSYLTGGAGRRAVHDVSLAIEPGQTVALVGESGSGKTTTAQAVIGLLPDNGRVEHGRILLNGTDIAGWGERRLRAVRGTQLSLVPQDPVSSLDPVQTIGAQIAEVFRLHEPRDRRPVRPRVLALLERVGIDEPEHRARQYPHELSGGMRQRVLIAIAVALHPRLIIADEPTSALDVTVQMQVLALLDDMVSQRGMGLILISHDLNLVATFCDRVLVMYGGRVVEVLEAGRLHDARHPYTRGLLNCLPDLHRSQEVLPVLERDPAWLGA